MAKTDSVQLNKKLTAFLVMLSVLLTSVASVAAYSRTAIINDGDEVVELSTSSIFTEQILTEANVNVGENDEVVRENKDGISIITVLRAFDVLINDRNTSKSVQMTGGTVLQALKKAGVALSENDSVEPSLDSQVTSSTKITVAPMCNITVTADGKTSSYKVIKLSVKDSLEKLGISLDSDDIINVDADEEITEGMSIVIKRVEAKNTTVKQTVSYKTTEKKTNDLYSGETKVKTQGKNGEKTITYKETYIDGKLTKKETVSSKLTKEPVNEVVLVGTKQKPCGTVSENDAEGSFIDENGNKVFYSSKIVGTATAYNESEGSLTATGVPVYYGGVAVDPSIIPYGSKLYIASNDGAYVYGYATAVDTGGAMLSGAALIDLFYNSEYECEQFGRRTVTVYIL